MLMCMPAVGLLNWLQADSAVSGHAKSWMRVPIVRLPAAGRLQVVRDQLASDMASRRIGCARCWAPGGRLQVVSGLAHSSMCEPDVGHRDEVQRSPSAVT